jgi:ERCC4-type nuclease
MPGSTIEVLMDSNEQQWQRKAAMEEAVASHPKTFVWGGLAEIPVDMRFRDTATYRTISVELKEPSDMVTSVTNGHLAKQILTLREAGEPGFVVCTGSAKDVFDAIPRYTQSGRRTTPAIYQQFGIIRHFTAASYADGYPVFFLDCAWPQFILNNVEAFFTVPTVLSYLHKDKDTMTAAAMLCMIPGVGAETAKGLISSFGSLRQVMNASQKDLESTIINGRKLGKKAAAIVEAFR